MAEIRGLQPKEGRLMPFFSPEETYTCGCYGAKYSVYSPNNALLPFVLNLPLESMRAFSVSVVNRKTGKVIFCVSSADIPHDLYTVNGVFIYVYNGDVIPGLKLAEGQQYTVELLGFKSCPIVAKIDVSCFVKVDIGNTNELFGLPYHRGFRQWIWLDAKLNDWDWKSYTIEDKDSLGRTTTTQSRLEKVWNVVFNELPEWIYKTLVTASILDSVILTQSIQTITASKKRSSAKLDNGIICEKTLTLNFPDQEADETDGNCTSVDEWINIDNELPVDACNSDVWVNTGRTRCLPILPIVACSPVPQFTTYTECSSGAGTIVLTSANTPEGDTAEYSIDNGSTFLRTGTFTRLPLGDYQIRVRFKLAGCVSRAYPISITCGTGQPGNWESTGNEFCLSVGPDSTGANWESTGNEFCLTIFNDQTGFDGRTLAEVCEDVLTN